MSDLIRVSHSQINEWDRCRFSYFLSYREKWRPKQKAYPLTLGSTVHTLLEDYYRGVMEDNRNLLERHRNKVQELSGSVADTDELQALSHAGSLVERYITDFAFYEDAGYEVVDVEKHYVVELTTPQGNPYEFELYFDLMLLHKQSQRLWIVDHKTHKSNPLNPTQIMMDRQLPSYALVMRELMGVDVFGMIYNMLNTYDYKKPPPPEKLFKREKTYRTPEELNSIMKEIGYAVDDILENRDNPRRSLTRDCSWCKFQEPCLMGMKGMNMKSILEENFEKKPERPKNDEQESNVRPRIL